LSKQEFIQYSKGRFTVNRKIIIDLSVNSFRLRIFDKRWINYLNQGLKDGKVSDFFVTNDFFQPRIVINFSSDSEMLLAKSNIIQSVKKAIIFSNSKINQDIEQDLKQRIDIKNKQDNIQKMNAYFEDQQTNLTVGKKEAKILEIPIIEIESNTDKNRYLVKLDDLKNHLIKNPTHKIKKSNLDNTLIVKIIGALDVNALDPFWNDEFGSTQINTTYLIHKTSSKVEIKDKTQNTEYTIKEVLTGKYHIFDPAGEELAATFSSLSKAQEFINKLSFIDGRSQIEINK
jgi:hypothetical protein